MTERAWRGAATDELVAPWFAALRRGLDGLELYDVHTHIGRNDPDGYKLEPEDLLAGLERAGARGVVFPMHEPGGYGPANDRVIEVAASSGGRLVCFCRVDPAAAPVEEARRCLDAGAAGIKLHPRAEGFALDHAQIDALVALAADRRRPVLIHAGRGIPALGRHTVALATRYPEARLILAHAAISDLAWLWQVAPRTPNLLIDTAWWNAADLVALFALVPPGQILYASDAPYGTPMLAAILALRCAIEAGLKSDQLHSIMGGQLARIIAGDALADPGPAPGPGGPAPVDVLLERIHSHLNGAIARMFSQTTGEESLALARLACDVPDDVAATPVARAVADLLDVRAARLDALRVDGAELPPLAGIDAVILAATLARAPTAPLAD